MEGFELLFQKSNWPHLKKIILNWIKIKDESVEILTSTNWPLLEYFSFENTAITEKGLEILTRTSHWPNLKELYISWNGDQDEGFKILSHGKWPLLETLRYPNTTTQKISDEGLEALASGKWSFFKEIILVNWPNLKNITLNWIKIQDESVEILTSINWPFLEYFSFEDTAITEKGLEILTRTSHWPNLKELYISWDGNQDEGLKILSHGKWPLLETLHYPNTTTQKISDEGLEALALGKWPFLKEILFLDACVKVKGFKALINQASWPYLKRLYFVGEFEKYDDAEMKALREVSLEKWPGLDLKITSDDFCLDLYEYDENE